MSEENEKKDGLQNEDFANMTAMCKVEHCQDDTFLLTVNVSGIPHAHEAKIIGEVLYRMLGTVMNSLYPNSTVVDEMRSEPSDEENSIH